MEYRLHDKVIQIKKDYDKDVFKEGFGIIISVNTADMMADITQTNFNVANK